jgi:hypothetical protein
MADIDIDIDIDDNDDDDHQLLLCNKRKFNQDFIFW